jgi:phosphoribosylformylglycinamidine (FGAM) synthase PurS component
MADEFNFDDYDDNFDFGFNTVDEAEVTEYETEIKSRVADQGGAVPSGLEEKIDKLIELRQGDETQLDVLKKEHKNNLLKVEKMIMPLLYNLMKNPEDIYIKWPNRKEIIQKQISRIVTITRGV